MSMKKGEVALLIIAPEYAFGPSESKQDLGVVPPNSTVYYEVELVSFVKVCDTVSPYNSNSSVCAEVYSHVFNLAYRKRNHGI